MNKLLANAAFAAGIIISSGAMAADKSITLAENNVDCADCPSIVKGRLQDDPGVIKVAVSLKENASTVVYDDANE